MWDIWPEVLPLAGDAKVGLRLLALWILLLPPERERFLLVGRFWLRMWATTSSLLS